MANEAGPGCQDLANYTSAQTAVSGDVSSTAGDIDTYRIQVTDDSAAYDVAWSMQEKDNGTFSYISGTETGLFEDITALAEPSANCREAYEGTDFDAPTSVSIGDYVSAYYSYRQEIATSGGVGTLYRGNGNQTEQTGWTPASSNSGYDCAIGADISAAGGVSKSVAGDMGRFAGSVTRKLMAKRTVSGAI